MADTASIYNFSLEGIDGKTIDFNRFRGKKLLIVNTASECGLTSQYAQLQELYDTFKGELAIVGCPSNDFGNQEPGDNAAIQQFCQTNFGVSFPLSSKLTILGDNKHPLYQWLTALNNGEEISWNFQKFLFDENGQLMHILPPSADPASESMLALLNFISN